MRDTVACDVDDILYEFYLMLALFHNQHYKTELRKESFYSYAVRDVWGGTHEQAIAKVWQFYGMDEFKFLPVVEGAVDGIRALAEKYDLVAVTGRPHGLQGITKESLERNFEGCFVEIHHTDAFGIGGGVPVPKVDVCQKIGARTIIEDCLMHAVPCADAGMDVILLDQPWNRRVNTLVDGIVRVHSWEGILSRLL